MCLNVYDGCGDSGWDRDRDRGRDRDVNMRLDRDRGGRHSMARMWSLPAAICTPICNIAAKPFL